MLAEVKVFIWNINFSFRFLKGNFSSSDLPIARDNAYAALESPSIRYVFYMEKFIVIFFPIDWKKIFKRKF